MISFGLISQNKIETTKSENDKITILLIVNWADYGPGLNTLSTAKTTTHFMTIKETANLCNEL